ncbi:deoxyuridine triphosphatase [Leporid alphaherpesvirus 4]|uniref:Deoxyuridine triphosphatase n=1 Tax=Leporid alphaherpesvirus 4 TaxID=481315 RepID=J9QVD9_9ALPH|nr:deoxyuridine triphosphatase [Leporid alphaherpesvirus 4]AFR32495.1 deoxyuridine triphosphatase [Leporid alphaherpesvirus 4]
MAQSKSPTPGVTRTTTMLAGPPEPAPKILVSVDTDNANWTVFARTQGRSVQLELYNRLAMTLIPEAFGTGGYATVTVSLGVRMAMPQNFCAVVHAPPRTPRSRYRVVAGLIDSGYRGIVRAVLLVSKESCQFAPGMLLVQISIHELSGQSPALTTPLYHLGVGRMAAADRPAQYTGARSARRGAFVAEEAVFLPKREEDAGTDIAIHAPVTIHPGGHATIQPSLRRLLHAPYSDAVYVLGRSSLNARGVIVTPTRWIPGRPLTLRIYNITGCPVTLCPGAKVAQIVALRYLSLSGLSPDSCGDGGITVATPHQRPARLSYVASHPPRIEFTTEFDARAARSERGEGAFGSTDAAQIDRDA